LMAFLQIYLTEFHCLSLTQSAALSVQLQGSNL
jgi:hypothetical protein